MCCCVHSQMKAYWRSPAGRAQVEAQRKVAGMLGLALTKGGKGKPGGQEDGMAVSLGGTS